MSAGNLDSGTVFSSLLRGMHPCSLKVAYLITSMGARGSIDSAMDFSTPMGLYKASSKIFSVSVVPNILLMFWWMSSMSSGASALYSSGFCDISIDICDIRTSAGKCCFSREKNKYFYTVLLCFLREVSVFEVLLWQPLLGWALDCRTVQETH